MRKYYITGFLLFLVVSASIAQPIYDRSAGVRLGVTSGFTFKKFFTPDEALEVILSGRREGIQLTTMYQFHQPLELSFNENFYFLYGIGGHVGYENYDNLNKTIVTADLSRYIFEDKSYFVIGADAIVGVEFRWLSVPCTIGFDIKPYFNFIGLRYTQYRFWDSAITFKYVF
jgi:hypothetical protein